MHPLKDQQPLNFYPVTCNSWHIEQKSMYAVQLNMIGKIQKLILLANIHEKTSNAKSFMQYYIGYTHTQHTPRTFI